MSNVIHVGIVEDQHLFRQGLTVILEQQERFRVVFSSPDGFSVQERLLKNEVVPDVMLIDLTLPPDNGREYGGSMVLSFIRENHPKMKIIILSVHDDPYLIAEMIEQGANGYLVKDSDPEEVYSAIDSVFEKGVYMNQRSLIAIQEKLRGNLTQQVEYEDLTKREVETLVLICRQHTSKEIGEELFISEKTVNGHRNNLLQKTLSRNVTGLVMYAVKHGIVEIS